MQYQIKQWRVRVLPSLGAGAMLEGEDGRREPLSAAGLAPPLPLSLEPQPHSFESTGPGAAPSGGILKHFSIVFRIISRHFAGFLFIFKGTQYHCLVPFQKPSSRTQAQSGRLIMFADLLSLQKKH